MPILLIILLAFLIGMIGFWDTLAALLGAVVVIMLFWVILGVIAIAGVLWIVRLLTR